jgi:hypothetical protein
LYTIRSLCSSWFIDKICLPLKYKNQEPNFSWCQFGSLVVCPLYRHTDNCQQHVPSMIHIFKLEKTYTKDGYKWKNQRTCYVKYPSFYLPQNIMISVYISICKLLLVFYQQTKKGISANVEWEIKNVIVVMYKIVIYKLVGFPACKKVIEWAQETVNIWGSG